MILKVVSNKIKCFNDSTVIIDLQALDFVVSEAKKYKIRLILSLANNWEAYGGKAQYVKWGKDAGLNLTSDDDFYSHSTLRSYYKSHVKASSFVKCNNSKPTLLTLKLVWYVLQ